VSGAAPAAWAQQEDDLADIDAFVEAQMDRHRILGLALAITEGDRIVHLRGYGSAGDGRPVTPQTPFHIGSISKSFTALAVMQLVEQGELDLEAPVRAYLPWFQVADENTSQAITVRHLLHQTSGLAEETYMADLPAGTTLERAVRDLRRAELVDTPGISFHYFNQNYATLGMIVETVSGQSYGDYVQTHVFDPLKMNGSAATVENIAELDIAQGHGMLFGFPIARRQEATTHDMPEGGIVSTAEDMAHFLIAQNNGGVYDDVRVLTAEGVAQMHRPDTPGAPPGEGYAMGWIVEEREGTLTLHHGGSLENFRAFAWLLPEEAYGFVVLINQNGFVPAMLAYSDIPEGIADLLTGNEPSTGPAMRMLYWALTAVITVVVALDLQWWLARFSSGWKGDDAKQMARPWTPWLGVAGAILRGGVFYILPTVVLQGMGRGYTWELGFSMAPTLILFIGWNVLMGVSKSIARVLMALRG
jgi:CubicO group peptidase (beta-lactamase class C family)